MGNKHLYGKGDYSFLNRHFSLISVAISYHHLHMVFISHTWFDMQGLVPPLIRFCIDVGYLYLYWCDASFYSLVLSRHFASSCQLLGRFDRLIFIKDAYYSLALDPTFVLFRGPCLIFIKDAYSSLAPDPTFGLFRGPCLIFIKDAYSSLAPDPTFGLFRGPCLIFIKDAYSSLAPDPTFGLFRGPCLIF
jgi:hypothetical protein